jgi:hypothetical protein
VFDDLQIPFPTGVRALARLASMHADLSKQKQTFNLLGLIFHLVREGW